MVYLKNSIKWGKREKIIDCRKRNFFEEVAQKVTLNSQILFFPAFVS